MQAVDLRTKSFDDLHKLWYVLLKERNMLATQKEIYQKAGQPMPRPDRIPKVGVTSAFTVVHLFGLQSLHLSVWKLLVLVVVKHMHAASANDVSCECPDSRI